MYFYFLNQEKHPEILEKNVQAEVRTLFNSDSVQKCLMVVAIFCSSFEFPERYN